MVILINENCALVTSELYGRLIADAELGQSIRNMPKAARIKRTDDIGIPEWEATTCHGGIYRYHCSETLEECVKFVCAPPPEEPAPEPAAEGDTE